MRVICTKTGVEFTSSGFNSFRVSSTHPLLHASFTTLGEVLVDWRKGQLTASESRVLLVALLESTNLLDWQSGVACNPTIATTQKYMELTYSVATWKNAVGSRIPLPRVAITRDTSNLENLGAILSAWNNAQREYTIGSHMQAVRDNIERTQVRLRRLLQQQREDSPLYAKHLAKWFMETAQVPTGLQEYWTKIFCLTDFEACSWPAQEIEEVLDHYHEHVPVSNGYAIECFKLLHRLKRCSVGGIIGLLEGNSPTYTIVTNPDGTKSEVLNEQEEPEDNETITRNRETIIALAPRSEPIEREYSNKLEYLVAKARWKVAVAAASSVKEQ